MQRCSANSFSPRSELPGITGGTVAEAMAADAAHSAIILSIYKNDILRESGGANEKRSTGPVDERGRHGGSHVQQGRGADLLPALRGLPSSQRCRAHVAG